MRIEDVIFEFHSYCKINTKNNECCLRVKYFDKSHHYECDGTMITNDNSFEYQTYDILLSRTDNDKYLSEIIEEMTKIESDDKTCEVIVLSHMKCYRFKANFDDVECLFTNMFFDIIDDDDDTAMTYVNKTIFKTMDGIKISKSIF